MRYIRLIAFLLLLSSVGPSYGVLVGSVADGAASSVIAGAATKKNKKKQRKPASPPVQLTDEEQRRYDYFFLEAARLKVQKEYAAAFDLLQHCLTIAPDEPSALYEIAQYYLFLKQKPLAQAALEKAVEKAPGNYWYSQALANLYMQQNETDKAAALLEQMAAHFSDKIDRFTICWKSTTRQKPMTR